MRLTVTIATGALLLGCSTPKFDGELPSEFTAIPKSSEFTGWILDHCNGATPIRIEALDCAQIGGEIYRVQLTDIWAANGVRLSLRSQFLVPSHGLNLSAENREVWAFQAKETTPGLQAATGIKYIAADYHRGIERK